MRVTKTVKEYIEREVRARVMPRYAAEEAEVNRRIEAKEDFCENCAKAAKEAWDKYYEEHYAEISDFCDKTDCRPSFYNSGSVRLRDSVYTSSIYRWRDRFNRECQEIVNEIVVELELGGTKKELMEMLSKISVD